MALWQNDLVLGIRALINDMGATQTYTDEKIQQCAVVAALVVSTELGSASIYSVDIGTPDISPDPVASGDYSFTALILLKSACILLTNNFIAATAGGIKVRSGTDEVDNTRSLGSYEAILKLGPCASYSKLLLQRQQWNSMLRGKAIASGPISHESFSLSARYGYISFWNMFAFKG